MCKVKQFALFINPDLTSESRGQGIGVRGEVKQDLLEINLQIVCFGNWLHFTFKQQEL